MTCLEAQSNIMAFLDKKLPDDVTADFVRHMRYCKNCSEELEIYYTLVVGMKQVDNNQELSSNFAQDLERELSRLEHKVRSAKRFKVSTFSIVFVAAIVFLMFLYNQCLAKVYNIEQIMKYQAQGQMYFYETFAESMEVCTRDVLEETQLATKPKESTFYEKVRQYRITHPEIEEDVDEETVIN